MPYPPAHQVGPRIAVWLAGLLRDLQTAKLPSMSEGLLLFENAQSAKMSDWSNSVLAAEATKAGSASEVTLLIPGLHRELAGWPEPIGFQKGYNSTELLATRATHSIARSLLRQRVCPSVCHTPVLCLND